MAQGQRAQSGRVAADNSFTTPTSIRPRAVSDVVVTAYEARCGLEMTMFPRSRHGANLAKKKGQPGGAGLSLDRRCREDSMRHRLSRWCAGRTSQA